jgi:integrase
MESHEQILDAYSVLIYNTKAPSTQGYYLRRLRIFFDYIELLPSGNIRKRCNYFVKEAKGNSDWAFSNIVRFLQFQRDRAMEGKITNGTLKNYWKPIKLLCDSGNVTINVKNITRGLPKVRRYANDRAPTITEIQKICEYPDRRIKTIVYIMASSGIRLGAWEDLKWENIIPITRNGITLAKMTVYAGTDEEYYTFITPEAYNELKKWMDYRKESGEDINEKSWVMRQLWNAKKGRKFGLVTVSKKLREAGMRSLMEHALWSQGVRNKSQLTGNRYEFQANHGLRKWFKTKCELAGMKSINVELLIGHSIGLADSYYRITENELLEDYLKAIDNLSINKTSNKTPIIGEKEIKRINKFQEDLKKIDNLEPTIIHILENTLSKMPPEKLRKLLNWPIIE